MRNNIVLFFATFLINSVTIFGQYPDTIIIKTERVKGFGPFRDSLPQTKEVPKDNPWYKSMPEIKGITNDLEHQMFAIEQTDFLQHTYQSYYSQKIDKGLFDSFKESANWELSPEEYSKNFVKIDIAIIAGYDRDGLMKIKVDKNNNYDLSDDEYFTLPKKLPGQNYWGRYYDLLPFEVMYEYYDGESIKQAKTWLYIDYFISQYYSKKRKPHPIELAVSFAEHHLGEFNINGKIHFAAIKASRAVFREDYNIKIWNAETEKNISKSNDGIQRNGFIKIEDYYYRFDNATIDGSLITLVKDKSVLEKGGNQVGFKAINFISKTINGKEIELNNLKGNVVMLDFWGTWCAPCRDEIPKLKSIYEEYKDKNFVMIGIAKDDIASLKNYVEENDVKWNQIIQADDMQIISDYGIVGYPTTFLIDKDGVIIAKGLRAEELEVKLAEIFAK